MFKVYRPTSYGDVTITGEELQTLKNKIILKGFVQYNHQISTIKYSHTIKFGRDVHESITYDGGLYKYMDASNKNYIIINADRTRRR